jgi:geranyl-CoA carboxylase beta subunit
MTILGEEGAKRAGREPDMKALGAAAKQIIDTYDEQSTALFATARLWDDGIIDPRDSRRVVGLCLDVCQEADERRLRPNTFGVARM